MVQNSSAAIGIVALHFLSKAIQEEPGLRVNIKMDCANFPDIQSYNVIGQLTGSEKPDEIIVAGGHFDSWDKGCSSR